MIPRRARAKDAVNNDAKVENTLDPTHNLEAKDAPRKRLSRRHRGGYLAVLAFLSASAWAADPSAAPYSIFDLGTLGGQTSVGTAINNNGTVVGWSLDSIGARRAFMYADEAMTSLGTLETGPASAYAESSASDISDAGHVVGYASTDSGARHAFLYRAGTMQDLGTLGGDESFASGVSAKGQVVGTAKNAANEIRGFVAQRGKMEELGQTGCSRPNTYPYSVNDYGQVVGSAPAGDCEQGEAGVQQAFLYSTRIMLNLGSLRSDGQGASFATRINEPGQIVGHSDTPEGASRAFLIASNQMVDLGALGGTISRGYGINNHGQVVGYAFDKGNQNQLAFLYGADVGMLDLNRLLPSGTNWIVRAANAINDHGQITGWGEYFGQPRAFLMTPDFPKTPVIDAFRQRRDRLGHQWSGDTDRHAFVVENAQVRVREGGTVYWRDGEFGEDQEAYLTLFRVDQAGRQGLLLKAQGTGGREPDPRDGVIRIVYNAKQKWVRVSTRLPRTRGWTAYRPFPATFQDGDQFGARAYATGAVRIYKNHLPLTTVVLNEDDAAFFESRGGTVGAVFVPSSQPAVFGLFGAGTTPD